MRPNRSIKVWKQIPLFRAIWPFIGGIILGIFLPDVQLAWMLSSAVFVLLIVVLFLPRITGVMLLVALFFGYAITVFETDRLYDSHVSNFADRGEVTVIGTVYSDPIPRERSIKAQIEVEKVIHESDTSDVQGSMLIYFAPDDESGAIRFGDRIAFQSRLNSIPPPQNPNEFNYKRYMGFHQITEQVYLQRERWELIKAGEGFRRYVFALQHSVIETIQSFDINDRELAILSALLVGYKHYLSTDQVNAFASAGAMHVLAVSGLHVGIIYLILHTLLKFMDKRRWSQVLKGILMILALWFYATLTGLSPSVTRAATMFTFVTVARQFGRHTDIFNTLASSAFLLLALNPFLIVEVGFQLSYLAVLGIVLLQPRIYELWQPKYWLIDKMWAITAVSLAAQAATFPLALLYFHQFPNYFLLSNLVVIPAATIILPIGVALVALNWVPMLSQALAFVLYWLIHLLDLFIQWVDALPYSLILGIDITIFETYLIYMVVATSCVFLITKRYKWLLGFIAIFIATESLNVLESLQQKSQKAIVFYKVRGADAINFIDGHEHVFLADTVLSNNFDRMRFHIHHHWWNRDLREPQAKLNGFHQSGPLIQFENFTILKVDSTTKLNPEISLEPDVFYISHRTKQHPKELLDFVKPKEIILSPNIDWRSHNYWLRLCEERSIAVHSLRDSGAKTIELSPSNRFAIASLFEW